MHNQLKQVTVPNIGDFKNVEVIEVSVKQGDTIKKEQTLVTLETDKAAMEIPSPYAGVVTDLKLKIGDKVSEGDLILVLEMAEAPQEKSIPEKAPDSDKSPAGPARGPAPTASALTAPPPPVFSSGPVHAGPATRRLAYELGVDLSKVGGTGQKGRIMKIDVQQYVKSILTGVGAGHRAGPGSSGLNVEPMPEIDFSKWGEIESQPVKRIKKISAKFLHRNWVTIPHVTNFDEVDITELEAFRQANKNEAEKLGVKLTPIVFIMKAIVSALKAYPEFNSSLSPDGQTLVLKKYFHIGVAVDTPDGLVVPVIREVDQKGIFDLAKELGEISGKARSGKLTSGDMQGGCFTISSLGGIGGTNFTPIINAPEVAILGVSRSSFKPIYKEGNFEPKLILPLSLSYDHRVIDGAQAARFLVHLTEQLKNFGATNANQ